MKTIRIPSEGYGANCWLVLDEASGEYLIVDPSPGLEIFAAFLRQRELDKKKLRYILLTHGHFDHILGADEIRDYTGAPLLVHKDDAACLTDSDRNVYKYFFRRELTRRPAERLITDGEVLPIGNTAVSVLHTPGHSEGGVCYISDDSIYSGDTLFDLGIGRTDLTGSDPVKFEKSLKRLLSLPGDYTVYPGHGSVTTLQKQRELNPYLKGLI